MNNQDNQNKQVQEPGNEGTRTPSTKQSFFAKRWTFPVIYLAASVLIVGLIYANQDRGNYEVEKKDGTQQEQAGPNLPDAQTLQANAVPNFMWPVGEGGEDAVISMDFYRDDASDEDKAKAITVFENAYHPNNGVNIGLQSDATFGVIAAAKGTVTEVKEDPLMGRIVEIDHGNGYSTYYASLTDVKVQKGANVLAGEEIAKSGNNKFEKAEKNHLHFEVRKDGKAVDPNSVLPKKPKGDAKSTTGTATSSTSTDAAKPAATDSKPDAKTETDAKKQDGAKPEDTTKPKEATDPKDGTSQSTTKPAESTDKDTTKDNGGGTDSGATDMMR